MDNKNRFLDLSKYHFLCAIGEGEFGSVLLIEDDNEQKYAAKVSFSEVTEETRDFQATYMLFREINLMSILNHPSILKFIGYSPIDFDGEPCPTIVTEFATNKSLQNMIKMEKEGLSPDGWNDTQKLINIYGIAAGMSYLHSHNIIHRDLKPANILLNCYLHPIIADFGLSKTTGFISNSMNFRSKQECKGTMIYMAPEMLKYNDYSNASDVYAFAFVVYEILFGEVQNKRKFNLHMICNDVCERGVRPEIDKDAPLAYRELIESCWAQIPSDRPSFDEIVDKLRNNESFITKSINKADYYNYVNYIETYKSSYNVSNRMINFDSFVKNFRRIKVIESFTLHNSNKLTRSAKNPSKRRCPLIEIEKEEKLQKIKRNIKSILFPLSLFANLNEECKNIVCEAESDRRKQFFVGKSLIEGTNEFPKNIELGVEYIKRANKNNCLESNIYYINLLIKGEYIQQDYQKAEEIIKKFESFHDLSLFTLEGKIYRHNKKFKKARQFYKMGAIEGDDESMYQYAKMVFLGEGKKKNDSKAFDYFSKSVQNGYSKSVLFMAVFNELIKFKGFKDIPANSQYFFIKQVVKNYKKGMNSTDSKIILIPPKVIEEFYFNNTLKMQYLHLFLSHMNDISVEVRFPSPNFNLILDLLIKIKLKEAPKIKIGIVFTTFQSIYPKILFSNEISYHTIDSLISSIPQNAFRQCFILDKFKIKPNISEIGDHSFYQCLSLTQIIIPSSVKEIKEFTFFECRSLSKVIILSSVTKIGMSCFECCSSLTKIDIPSSVTEIGPCAFRSCKSLVKISLPLFLQKIDYSLFEGCTSLKKVMIPSSVVQIDEFAFSGCKSLKKLIIPDSVIKIEKNSISINTHVLKKKVT